LKTNLILGGYMKKIITGLLLTLLTISAFAETETEPQQPKPSEPTTSQNTTPPATPKESTTNIVDFCRTHTC
jgi:hypothetical protein